MTTTNVLSSDKSESITTTITDSIEEIISSAFESPIHEKDKLEIVTSAILNKIKEMLPSLGTALIVLVVGIIATKISIRIFNKCLARAAVDAAAIGFLSSILKILLYILTIIITLSILNIPMTSIIAVLSAAGLAIGLALQNSLSNLAGGFIILFSKPFKSGDYVETNSAAGTVESINILYTKIITNDNKSVYIPNGMVAESQIINYSEQNKRRVDFEFGISYSDDLESAKKIILELAAENNLVLNEPETPFVRLGKQADDSLQIDVRLWVATENYWQVKYDFTEAVNTAFNENNITIPYRQLDVHIHKGES